MDVSAELERFASIVADAMVVYANSVQFARGQSVSYPRVESRMLLYCQEGRGDVCVNGRRLHIEADTVLLLPWRHSIGYQADRVSPFLLAGVHLAPWHDPEVTPVFNVAHGPGHPLYGSPARKDRDLSPLSGIVMDQLGTGLGTILQLLRLALTLFRSDTFDAAASNSIARLLLRELYLTVRKLDRDPLARAPTRDALGEVERYVLENLNTRITMEDLCAIAATSPSTLRRNFVRAVGLSPYEWVLAQRVRVAAELLRTGSLRIAEIAERVGVADPGYFSRLFSAHFGKTPREYRQEQMRL